MTDSYRVTFGCAGVLLIISSIISFFIPNKNYNPDDQKDDQKEEPEDGRGDYNI